MTEPLWTPSAERAAAANVTAFMAAVEAQFSVPVSDYEALYRWSVAAPEDFWRAVWSFTEVIAETQGGVVLADADKMPGARFFPEARLNFAENLLRRRDGETAIVFRREDGMRRTLSFAELYDSVSVLAQALAAAGVAPGDRVAGVLANAPETIIAMLATASLGAIWSSCSPDFGVEGVLDRFGQIAPKILLAADGYFYNGRHIDLHDRLQDIVPRLPGLERLIVVPYAEDAPPLDGLGDAIALPAFTADFTPREIAFRRLPFNHPLFIMYSSGTTGVPKCIVHGAGGTLLKHLCELRLHTDLKRGDRLFYATTCGWMMWNWLVSGLAAEASLLFVRRGAVSPRRAHPIRFRRGRGDDDLRHLGQVSRRRRQGRHRARRGARSWRGEDDSIHRLAARPGQLRVRLPEDQARRLPVFDLGRHRHHRLLRARQPGRPGVAGRVAKPRARPGGRGVRRIGTRGARATRRAGVHGALPLDAGRFLGRSRRCPLSRRLLRDLPGRVGATATSSN